MKRVGTIALLILIVVAALPGYPEYESIDIELENLLELFKSEPSINEVQEAAVRYAEVYPEKIRDWRRAANISALLPRISLGIDRNKADTYEIYTSSTQQYIVEGPSRDSDGWDITLIWSLGDLIWNDDQAEIDARSTHMVQLRRSILSRVNEAYFERQRLQLELLKVTPGSIDKIRREIRISELNAELDGLTGGFFTRSLNGKKIQ